MLVLSKLPLAVVFQDTAYHSGSVIHILSGITYYASETKIDHILITIKNRVQLYKYQPNPSSHLLMLRLSQMERPPLRNPNNTGTSHVVISRNGPPPDSRSLSRVENPNRSESFGHQRNHHESKRTGGGFPQGF